MLHIGTNTIATNLAGLSEGDYSLTGKFILSLADKEEKYARGLMVNVKQINKANKLISCLLTDENGVRYFKKFYYRYATLLFQTEETIGIDLTLDQEPSLSDIQFNWDEF